MHENQAKSIAHQPMTPTSAVIDMQAPGSFNTLFASISLINMSSELQVVDMMHQNNVNLMKLTSEETDFYKMLMNHES